MAENTARLLRNVPLPDEIFQVHNNAVVIDTGGATVKAGFSGDDCPRIVIPTCTGVPKDARTPEAKLNEMVAGNVAYKSREELDMRSPVVSGYIEDWDSMEKIWEHLYLHCLKVQPDDSDTPLILSEPALNPKETRERMCQFFFETLKVPALYVAVGPALALYASGRTTGVVVESGLATTHTVPIFEGFSLYHSILQLDYGGQHLTAFLRNALAQQHNIRFGVSHETEVCNYLKETLCSVALDYRHASANEKDRKSLTLPDGTVVDLGVERYTCCEALFDPTVIGLPARNTTTSTMNKGLVATTVDSIKKCDADITYSLFNNIVLSGGNTMFLGIQERFNKDLLALVPASTSSSNPLSDKLKIFATTERKYSTWIGGSILASIPTFQSYWIPRSEYDENPMVVHRNCY